jgi:hypothetical protein
MRGVEEISREHIAVAARATIKGLTQEERMPELAFKNVDKYWQGNDYKNIPERPATKDRPARPAEYHHVSMTSVALGKEPPFALIFMTHMNLDFDGAGNACGPDNLEPLDYLKNAINKETGHYVGVKAGQMRVSTCHPTNRIIRRILRLVNIEEEPGPCCQQIRI